MENGNSSTIITPTGTRNEKLALSEAPAPASADPRAASAGSGVPDGTELLTLATEINREHAAVGEAIAAGLGHARHAGELLRRAKARLGHGEWLSWLQSNFSGSRRTAQAYMSIADRYSELKNAQRVAPLSYREALALLAKSECAEAADSDTPTRTQVVLVQTVSAPNTPTTIRVPVIRLAEPAADEQKHTPPVVRLATGTTLPRGTALAMDIEHQIEALKTGKIDAAHATALFKDSRRRVADMKADLKEEEEALKAALTEAASPAPAVLAPVAPIRRLVDELVDRGLGLMDRVFRIGELRDPVVRAAWDDDSIYDHLANMIQLSEALTEKLDGLVRRVTAVVQARALGTPIGQPSREVQEAPVTCKCDSTEAIIGRLTDPAESTVATQPLEDEQPIGPMVTATPDGMSPMIATQSVAPATQHVAGNVYIQLSENVRLTSTMDTETAALPAIGPTTTAQSAAPGKKSARNTERRKRKTKLTKKAIGALADAALSSSGGRCQKCGVSKTSIALGRTETGVLCYREYLLHEGWRNAETGAPVDEPVEHDGSVPESAEPIAYFVRSKNTVVVRCARHKLRNGKRVEVQP